MKNAKSSWTAGLKFGLAALAAGACIVASGAAASAEVDMYDGQWHFAFTPYLWLPSFHGDLDLPLPTGSISVDVQVNPGSYLSDLQFGFMAAGQVRKGDFAFVYDLVFADLKGHNSKVHKLRGVTGDVQLPVDVNVTSKLDTSIVLVGPSYTVGRSDQGSIDVFGAVAISDNRASADLDLSGPLGAFTRSGSVGKTVTLTQGVFGWQGHLRLSDDGKWYMPYEIDGRIGAKSTGWNGIIGVGYRFGWGDVLLAYRNLYYTMNNAELLQNIRFSGPALGASFRW